MSEQLLSNVKSDLPLLHYKDKSERLTQETLARFKDLQLPFFNEKILRQFPCNLWLMPLPKAKHHRALVPAYAGVGLALLILYSSQNWIASLVVIGLGLCGAGLYRSLTAYRHFFPLGYGQAVIDIDEQGIYLPGIYFENNCSQKIDKENIRNIRVYWNWCKSINTASYHAYYSGYIFMLDIELHNHQHILLPATSFDSNRFMATLVELDYEAQLIRINKIPMLWRFCLMIGVAVSLCCMSLFGLYKLFTGGYLF